MRAAKAPILLGCALALAACSDEDPPPREPLACDGAVETVTGQPGLHVAVGAPIEWTTNPPATGTHYGAWARWGVHYAQLQRGFWMHNAEHGGVVLLYNCPAGCPEVVEALLEVARAVPVDGACVAPVRNRIVVAADPLLPAEVQVAAVAWNHTYTASCFDPYVATFVARHYGNGPEDVCADGVNLGGEVIAGP